MYQIRKVLFTKEKQFFVIYFTTVFELMPLISTNFLSDVISLLPFIPES